MRSRIEGITVSQGLAVAGNGRADSNAGETVIATPPTRKSLMNSRRVVISQFSVAILFARLDNLSSVVWPALQRTSCNLFVARVRSGPDRI